VRLPKRTHRHLVCHAKAVSSRVHAAPPARLGSTLALAAPPVWPRRPPWAARVRPESPPSRAGHIAYRCSPRHRTPCNCIGPYKQRSPRRRGSCKRSVGFSVEIAFRPVQKRDVSTFLYSFVPKTNKGTWYTPGSVSHSTNQSMLYKDDMSPQHRFHGNPRRSDLWWSGVSSIDAKGCSMRKDDVRSDDYDVTRPPWP
jgi:hypothetical protein